MLIEMEACLFFATFSNNRQEPASDQFNQSFKAQELNNRQIFDGVHLSLMRSWSLYRKLDLPLNNFETKAVGFCKRATDVIVVKFYCKRM